MAHKTRLTMSKIVIVVGMAASLAPAEAKRLGGAFSAAAARPVPMPGAPASPSGWRTIPAPKAPSYIGGPTPKVTFNRLSVGGASGINPALRARAYRAIDEHGSKNFGNKGPVFLPRTDAQGNALKYREMRLREGDHARKYSNGRVTVAVGPKRVAIPGTDRTTNLTGPAYVSRHHGDGGGRVVRIQ